MTIRDLRTQRGWSQDELAARAGVNRVTIADLEIGAHAPRKATIKKIARALGVEARGLDSEFRKQHKLSTTEKSQAISKRHGARATLRRMFDADPSRAVLGEILATALLDAENADVPGLAAEARFWLKFGDGRDWAELLGVEAMFDRALAELPALPGEGKGSEIVRLSRVMDLEYVA